MSLRGYFYRTWYPGMNNEHGEIDPDKVYDCSRRLAKVQRWLYWILFLSFLLFILIVIIYNLVPGPGSPEQPTHPTPPQAQTQDGDSALECPEKGDEVVLCPCRTNHSFYCNGPDSDECILPEMVCDGVKDCKSGEDEAICISLSSSALIMETSSSSNELEGYAIVRLRGSWHPYCSNDWSGEMGLNICRHLGFPQMRALETIGLTDYKERVLVEDGQSDRTEYSTAQLLVKEDMDDSEGKVLNLDLSDDREESEWLSCRIGHLKCVLNNGKA